MHGIACAFAIKCVDIIVRSTHCYVIEILMSYGKSIFQVKTRNLLNSPCIIQFCLFFFFFFFFCWKSLAFSILFDEKYFVYRSIILNYKKNNGIKGSTTLKKVTGEQSAVLSFLGFSRNVSGQKLLGYHSLVFINRGAKLYSQRRANLKILILAPGLKTTFLRAW